MTRLFLINFLIDVKLPEFWRFISIFTSTETLNFSGKTLRFLDVKPFFLSNEITIGYLFKIEISIIKIKKFFFIKKIDIITSLIDLIEVKIIIRIKEISLLKVLIIVSNFLEILFGYAKMLF